MSIEQNLLDIRQNIENACKKAGRKKEDVCLLAVTKTIDAQRINEAISLGVTDIGENRVQELLAKYCTVRHSSFLAWDRVHPNQRGATLLAREFLSHCGFDYEHKAY